MIYIVEDDSSIRELVAYTLSSQGMEAEGFECPSAFLKALEKKVPDLVLLDIMLPETDGLSVLKRLKGTPAYSRLPVIMLTAKGSEYDTVLGLDSGADDYIPKPFGMMELLARIRAVLRRTGEKKGEIHEYGAIRIYPDSRRVTVNGSEISLTSKEFDLLDALISQPEKVCTRSQLLSTVWGYISDGESRTVDVHIKTLRQKLGEAGQLIETVRGMGYKIGGNEK
ncbi:MAG TPA: response regulator transcription factor [Candidatus Lachnoclostridium stercorigallinarum]|uniref:Stage 0 sporulation protein A homolog n=1 Tax=Candidatus Lachnoclostridium stercorigallinarum TaxID=2838634 RepID=A0A9D2K5D6_9FIRM|nr:response regulator transcription factor [Candidatus Lachnoclostridium stercorigallinarum]